MRPDDHMMTVEEVAEFLRLSPSTIRIWCSKGKIPYRKVGKRSVRFLISDILDWMEKRGPQNAKTSGL